MIFWENNSFLFSTGLPLKTISELLVNSSNENELKKALGFLGEKYLFRYETIKNYYSLTKQGLQKLPLIIIIAGIPGTGKTILARELSTALNISLVIGGDALRSALRSLLPKESFKVFFTSIYNTWKFFGEYTSDNLLLGYKEQSRIMNLAIERMVADRGIRDGESLIVEYLQFLPSQFDNELLEHPSIIPIILRINDKQIYQQRLASRSNYSHLGSSGERLITNIDKYLLLQENLCAEASKYNLPIIDIDNFSDGFDQALELIITRVSNLNKIKKYNKSVAYLEDLIKERRLIE
ncbi:MAG: hypothetical protein JXA54_14785 [Candidatus Heimdallarchaeota archaeon]|nr:hypothetical protein [Candidatus Heimdallarchaeota archaeon]